MYVRVECWFPRVGPILYAINTSNTNSLRHMIAIY